MAEIELNVLAGQCLSRRIDNISKSERKLKHGSIKGTI